MGYRVSFLAESVQDLQGDGASTGLTGQKLSRLRMLRTLLRRPEIDVLEVLVEPSVITSSAAVGRLAESLLAPDLIGKGKLEILPSHFLPEIWGDGRERLIFCHQVNTLARDRRLRDRWAKAASPLFWGTSFQPASAQQIALQSAANLDRVDYDRVLCISHCVKRGMEEVFSHFGSAGPASVDYLPHIVDLDYLKPADHAEKAALRQRFGLPETGVIVLHFSRLTPSSKADLAPLVEKFCRDCHEGEHLVIAGASNAIGYVETLKSLVPSNRQGQVHIRGEVPPAERRDFIAACDVFAFPADFLMEGQGLAVYEALACGLPVVASHLTGASEPINDGVNGFKVPTWILPAFDRVEAMAEISSFAVDGILQAQCVWFDWSIFMSSLWSLMRDTPLRQQFSQQAVKSMDSYGTEAHFERFFGLVDQSFQAARSETTAREERRARLKKAGPPVRMWDVFHFSGTQTLTADTPISITEEGRAGLRSGEGILVYSDLLPFSNKELQRAILSRLAASPVRVGQLQALAPASELGLGDLHLQIGLLLRQGWLSIGVCSD
jgi:glycosyltransferase involved in cell wall biosynthesis